MPRPVLTLIWRLTGRVPTWERRRLLGEKIERIAGLYRVDLVFLKKASKDFQNIILKTGRVIYER